MRVAALLVALAACGKADKNAPPPPPKVAPKPPPVAIEGATGAIELMPSDGGPMNPMAPDIYAKEFAASKIVLVATKLPKLSPKGGLGANMFAGDRNVSWAFDLEPKGGYRFVYDANANGDLTDDPMHSFAPGATPELTLIQTIAGATPGSTMQVPVRLRVRDGKLYAQAAMVRRGTLALPKGALGFALIGDRGRFGEDYHFVTFDLNRDGVMDLESIDAAEQIRVFEGGVTIDGQSYAFSIEGDGSGITLAPLAKPLPERAKLYVGAAAPDFTVTAFDGKSHSLASLRGKVVLIDFWATSCHPCVKALPRLKTMHATFAPKGFELMAIAMPTADVKAVLADHGAGIETADEPSQAIYRIDRFPTYFLVDRAGNFACSRCTLDDIEKMIPTLL